MKMLGRILALALMLAGGPALAQVTPGTSPLTIAKGGTNAATASAARTSLGLAIGTNVEAWDADLDCLAALSSTGIIKRTGAGTCSTVVTAIADGGTGQIAQQAALNALAPTPTRAGDVLYYNGTNWVSFAGNNSGTQFFTENASGVPAWATVSGTGTVTSVTCFGVAITTAGTCATAATKSDEQTGTSTTAVVTPSQQQQHDSAAKSHGLVTSSTGAILESYNVASVTRTAAGTYTVVWTTAFASANYDCTISTESAGGNIFGVIGNGSRTASQIQMITVNTTPAAVDAATFGFNCHGRQ